VNDKVIIALALGVLGVGAYFKFKKPPPKAASSSSRVQLFPTMGKMVDKWTDTKGCTVLVLMRTGVEGTWRAAANRLSKQYPAVVFYGTNDPDVGTLFDKEDAESGSSTNWRVSAVTGIGGNELYSSRGTELNHLESGMESAAEFCAGVA
jgi:hypothetical protein